MGFFWYYFKQILIENSNHSYLRVTEEDDRFVSNVLKVVAIIALSMVILTSIGILTGIISIQDCRSFLEIFLPKFNHN